MTHKQTSDVPYHPTGDNGRLFVFDIGNVLLRFDPRRAARNIDRHDPGKGDGVTHSLWTEAVMDLHETGRLDGPGLYDLLRSRHNITMPYATFLEDFCDIFDPIQENVDLFLSLTRLGPVALLSNVGSVHWDHIFRRYPFLKAAKIPCASFELGVMKPHPRAYMAVAERSGIPMDRMVYVDDRAEFISAAQVLGITSIRYTGERPLADLFAEAGVVLPGKENPCLSA